MTNTSSHYPSPRKASWDLWIVAVLSAVLLCGTWFKWLPIDFTDALGFVSGAVCVWLITIDNIWNWPVGLANNLFFAILFWRSRLYSDFGLQWVYFALGIYGWWQWLRGGVGQSALKITRTRPWERVALAAVVPVATWGLMLLMIRLNGSAPFWDAFTTVLSLAAQYLLCRKRIENWFIWIAADVIYVPLYSVRGLPLTAILYAGFIILCVVGILRWRKEMRMPKRFGLGVVIGKFLPPHRGHRFLIETALSRCDHLTVIVCGKPIDPIPAEHRAAWLREIVPAAEVMLIDDRYDENDSRIWAENTIGWLGRAPDAVFTSEDYGDAYAGHMGCSHVLVDKARTTIPCSGTAVRQNPWAMAEYLDPPVRAWFVKRIIIVGAESTGTTTLAMDLAKALDEPWVAEHGREYSADKQSRGEEAWTSKEFISIGNEQTRRENLAAREAKRFVIGDTNAFATVLWHRRYMECEHSGVTAMGDACRADLYFLTGDEIPFVQDGLRDGEHLRHDMHRWFEEALAAQATPWFMLRGSREERLKSALAILREHWPAAFEIT